MTGFEPEITPQGEVVLQGRGMEKLKINVKEIKYLGIEELHEFQGDLKSLSDENFNRLKNDLISTGFDFVLHVWLDPKSKQYKLIDGHQRLKVLTALHSEGSLKIPKIPVALISAKNLKEAKKKVLKAASQHGETNRDSVLDFGFDSGFDFSEVQDSFVFPGIDLGEKEEKTGSDPDDFDKGEENLKPFKKTYVLIELRPEQLIDIEQELESIKEKGIEFEIASN